MSRVKKVSKRLFMITIFFTMVVSSAISIYANEESEVTNITIIADTINVTKGDEDFDLMKDVVALDEQGEEYLVSIKDMGNFNVHEEGEYHVTYQVDGIEEDISKERLVIVEEEALDNIEQNQKETFTPLALGSVNVSNEVELRDELSSLATITEVVKTINITQDITLTDSVTIDLTQGKDVKITSNSNAKVTSAIGKAHFLISDGSQNFTLENVVLNGNIESSHISGNSLLDTVESASTGGGIKGNIGTSSTVNLTGVKFQYIKDKAVDVFVNGVLNINDSTFLANSSEIEGSAVKVGGPGQLNILNTKFENNYAKRSWQINYIGATIFVGNTNTNVTIERSSFVNNKSYEAGTNASAVGGGAIAFKQATGNLTVKNSYFLANSVESPIGKGVANGTTTDGGAIYSFHSPGKIQIESSTFDGNVAGDEGGAISLVCSNNSGNTIQNNTFVNNTSKGQQVSISSGVGNDGQDGGGAIELNGDATTRTYASIINNTFYNNAAEKGNSVYGVNRGGAISFRNADAILKNNIISGNVTDGMKDANVYIEAGSNVTSENNVIDKDVKEIYGTSTPTLANNGLLMSAGGYPLQTLTILPNNGSSATGLADGQAQDLLATDQRGFQRAQPSDIGAIDSLYVEFNANGGNWTYTTPNEQFFDGASYYKTDASKKSVELLKLINYAGNTITPATNPEKENATFLGWALTSNATQALSDSEVADVLQNITENKVLYAVYAQSLKEGSFTVIKTDLSDSSLMLNDATFKLVQKDGTLVRDNITTNTYGKVVVNGVKEGVYDLIETHAPSGYTLDATPREITIQANEMLTIRMKNIKKVQGFVADVSTELLLERGSLNISAYDIADSSKLLSGVVIDIVDEDGDIVEEGLKTDKYGNVTVEKLPIGNYEIHVKKAPKGYSLNRSIGTVVINKNQEIVTRVALESSNEKTTTENQIVKQKDEYKVPFGLSGNGYVMFTKAYKNDDEMYYRSLPGAVFKVTHLDSNTVLGNYTSDEYGEIYLQKVAFGTYRFEEVSPAPGYHIPLGTGTVEITVDAVNPGNVDGGVVNVKNADPTGYVTLIKRDYDTQQPLQGVEFQLLDENKVAVRTGLLTDVNGKIVVDGLVAGKYYFQETKPLDGYYPDAALIDIYPKIDGQQSQGSILVYTENGVIRSKVTISKVDADDHSIHLANATFTISGTNLGKKQEATVTTGANGKITSNTEFIPGTYTVTEVQAPEGYEDLDAPLTLTVNRGGTSKNAEFVIENKKKNTIKEKGTLVVRYEDESGALIEPETITSEDEGTVYTTTQKAFPNYTFKEIKAGSASVSGTYEKNVTKTVTYVYTKDQGTLVVRYEDEDGILLEPETRITADVGKTYTTVQKSFPNYTFKEMKSGSAAVSGIYEKDMTKTVTYVYSKNPGSPDTGKLIVRYEDVTGKLLEPEMVTQRVAGDAYTTTQKVFADYTFVEVKAGSDATSGTYEANITKMVTYVYVRDTGTLIVRYEDEDGNLLEPETITTNYTNIAYTTSPKTFVGYTFLNLKVGSASETGVYLKNVVHTVTYVYKKDVDVPSKPVDPIAPIIKPSTLPPHTGDSTKINGYIFAIVAACGLLLSISINKGKNIRKKRGI